MPPDFNPSYQVPNWGWWIVLYFFFGGVTGGIYFAAAWLDLFGDANDRAAIRLGHLLGFPLIIICSVFLIADLGQPLRFWHMVFQSERFPEPILKPYSPMSLGSLILVVFGTVSFLSFVDEVLARGRLLHSPGNPIGKLLSIIGGIAGLALAGYTGALLNTTNEPVWGNSPWLSALFLFSGISTGIAALLLFARRTSPATVEKLSEADNYMMLFELITLVVFLVTLGAIGSRFIFGSATLVLFGIVTIYVCGSRILWTAAAMGHVFSTLCVYSMIALARFVDSNAFDSVLSGRDIGVSAICAAWLGAVAATLWRRPGRTRNGKIAIAAGVVLVGTCAYFVNPDLTALDSDHAYAFAIGAAVALVPVRALVKADTVYSYSAAAYARVRLLVVAAVRAARTRPAWSRRSA